MNRSRLFSLLCVLALAGCVTKPPPKPVAPAKPTPKPTYWRGETAKGPAKLVVKLGEQQSYFYKGETLVGEAPVSSGRRGFDTPTGNYKVIQKDLHHISNLYGDYIDDDGEVVQRNVDSSKDPLPEGATFQGANMPYFLRFYKGYGLHAGRLPGRRASHGCIRLPRSMAAHYYQNSVSGTPVIIEP